MISMKKKYEKCCGRAGISALVSDWNRFMGFLIWILEKILIV